MALNFKSNVKNTGEGFNLNLSAMADIMIVLIVFVLKASSQGMVQFNLPEGLHLPQAKATDDLTEVIRVEISPTKLLMDGKAILNLNRFIAPRSRLLSDGTISDVRSWLRAKEGNRSGTASRIPASALPPGRVVSKKILILADRLAPYYTVRQVLHSATEEGFTDFKLVVLNEE